jgi:hypothetical protein
MYCCCSPFLLADAGRAALFRRLWTNQEGELSSKQQRYIVGGTVVLVAVHSGFGNMLQLQMSSRQLLH